MTLDLHSGKPLLKVAQRAAQEDRRLRILLFLAQSNRYTLNAPTLQIGLSEIGHCVAMHILIADLCWLEELSLIQLNTVGDLEVAVLLQLGLDVANGMVVRRGISSPKPINGEDKAN